MTDETRFSPVTEPRFIFIVCDACSTEGRLLTNDGGPYDVDHGPCPFCNGEKVVEVEAYPIEMEDLDAQ